MDELTAAREFFSEDKYAMKTSGIEIDAVGEGYAKCSLAPDQRHMNAAGTVMGGALFTLADFAFAVATNRGGRLVQSLTSQITYHAVAKGSRVAAEARCIRSGRTTCYYNITITDDTGRLIATVVTTGYIHSEKPVKEAEQ